jgi:hypothetical protein
LAFFQSVCSIGAQVEFSLLWHLFKDKIEAIDHHDRDELLIPSAVKLGVKNIKDIVLDQEVVVLLCVGIFQNVG